MFKPVFKRQKFYRLRIILQVYLLRFTAVGTILLYRYTVYNGGGIIYAHKSVRAMEKKKKTRVLVDDGAPPPPRTNQNHSILYKPYTYYIPTKR